MDNGKIKLKRQLGISHGVAIIIGLIVGGGIYITPQGVLLNAGSPGLTLVIWIIGGVHSLLGALCYAELGIKFPFTGGEYAYLTELYSPYFGFVYLWIYLLLLRPGGNSFKALLLGRYILKPLYPYCDVPPLATSFVASVMAVFISALNCRSVKFAARGQNLMIAITISTLILIIVSGFYFLIRGDVENISNLFDGSTADIGDLVMSFYSTVFAYSGWTALNILIEEVKNPKRTLPVSIIISSITVTVLYTLVNYSYMLVLGTDGVLKSDAVAVSVALRIWTPMAWVMSLCIAVTACASFNSGILVGSRLAFAGARVGHLPRMISFVNITYLTPIISVIVQALFTMLFIWFVNMESIIRNLTFCYATCELFVILGLLKFRWKATDNVGTRLKMPIGVPMAYATSLTLITTIPLVTNFSASALIFIITVSLASTYYAIFILWRPTFISQNSDIDKLNNFVQKLFYCAPGGKNLLNY